jgi:hypothetical protein
MPEQSQPLGVEPLNTYQVLPMRFFNAFTTLAMRNSAASCFTIVMKSGIVFTVACGAGICAAVADDEQPARMTPKVVSAISCFFI